MLLVDDNLLETLVALFTDVLVDRHNETLSRTAPDVAHGADLDYTAGASGHVPAAIDTHRLPGNEVALRQHHRNTTDFVRRA